MNKKIGTSLLQTPASWDTIAKKAAELYPGRNLTITSFIQIELRKGISKMKLCSPCEFKEVDRVRLHFVVPPEERSAVICLCTKLHVDPARLISMIAIEPFLFDK